MLIIINIIDTIENKVNNSRVQDIAWKAISSLIISSSKDLIFEGSKDRVSKIKN